MTGDGAPRKERNGRIREDDFVLALRRIIGDGTPEVLVGAGDDCAVVRVGERVLILTVDMLVEGVHFDASRVAPRDLGYKAIAVNVSDVAAMAGSPRFGLIALGLPPTVDAPWAVELYGGMREAAGEYALSLVGGDTSRADRVAISVSVVGEVAPAGAVLRSGAQPGDRIVVTGALGASAGGLRLAAEEPQTIGHALGAAWAHDLIEAHDRPVARVGEGQALARYGATAMIDVSDGLALDLSRLCRESDVGAAVDLERVPVAPGLGELHRLLGTEPLGLALGGGEDYELLATIPAEQAAPAAEFLAERFGTPLTDIGHIRAERGMVAVEADGSERPLEPLGWDHLAADAG